MPDEAVASIRKLQILHADEERFGLHLDRLREQPTRPRPKDVHQGIVDLATLTKPDNIAILVHGYRSPLEIRVGLVANPDTPPFSNRHHPVSCIARICYDIIRF